MKKYGRARQTTDYNTIMGMHIAWITKATDTNSKYITLVTFPWHQWFCVCALMLQLYIFRSYCISLCNPNGTGVIINEHALSNINEIRLAVILQEKQKWKRRSSQILTRILGTSWTFFCNNLHSLQIYSSANYIPH